MNELFTTLSETSDGALKTRERLFAVLKAELNRHADLRQQHLFPVLKKHADTKEPLAAATSGLKEVRAKLAELDALPKNHETFLANVVELRKLFGQHARNEIKELLPAVQKALGEERVQELTEKIESSLAEAERAKHDDAEKKRAAAQQEGARAEQERQQAEQRAQQEANAKQKQQEVERRSRESPSVEGAARAASFYQGAAENMQTLLGSYVNLGRGLERVQRAYLDLFNSSMESMVHRQQDLSRASSPVQFAEAQRAIYLESVNALFTYRATLLNLAGEIAQDKIQPLQERVRSRGQD